MTDQSSSVRETKLARVKLIVVPLNVGGTLIKLVAGP